jgi:hypothetical protein
MSREERRVKCSLTTRQTHTRLEDGLTERLSASDRDGHGQRQTRPEKRTETDQVEIDREIALVDDAVAVPVHRVVVAAKAHVRQMERARERKQDRERKQERKQ